jgi:hypothetical protein
MKQTKITTSNKEICNDALRIKKILEKGCRLTAWPNAQGQLNLYLHKDGAYASDGVYICALKSNIFLKTERM